MENKAIRKVGIRKFKGGLSGDEPDFLAVEEPLEIRLEYGPVGHRVVKNLSVTMRTPGADEDLASGFLLTEGMVQKASDITGIRGFSNTVTVTLSPDLEVDLQKLERHF